MVFYVGKIKGNEEVERTSTTIRTGKKENASQSLEYHPVWQTSWKILKGSNTTLSP